MFDINVYHHVLIESPLFDQQLKELENRLMSAVSDKIQAATDAAKAETARIMKFVDDVNAKIAELRKTATSPADLQGLDDLKAISDGVNPTLPDTVPPTVLPPDDGGPTTPPTPPDPGGGTPPVTPPVTPPDTGGGTPPDTGGIPPDTNPPGTPPPDAGTPPAGGFRRR